LSRSWELWCLADLWPSSLFKCFHIISGFQGRVGGPRGDGAQLGAEELGAGDDGDAGAHQWRCSSSDPKKLTFNIFNCFRFRSFLIFFCYWIKIRWWCLFRVWAGMRVQIWFLFRVKNRQISLVIVLPSGYVWSFLLSHFSKFIHRQHYIDCFQFKENSQRDENFKKREWMYS